MLFAGARILTGIVIVGGLIAGQETAAFAQSCNSGTANVGDVLPVTLSVDSSQLAQFTLDTSGTDITMLIMDDQNNIACDTSTISASHLSCNWMPVSGATYTGQVMRAAAPADAASTSGTTPAQPAPPETYALCSMGAS